MPGHPASPGHPVRWLLVLLLACPAAALESGAVQASLGVDGRGRVLQVEQFRGRLLVVSLWASWCSSCLDELRALDELRRRHGDERIAILAMNAGETEGAVAAMAARLEPHGLWLTRVEEVDSALFPDAGVPQLLVLDAGGRRVYAVRGYVPGLVVELERALPRWLEVDSGQ